MTKLLILVCCVVFASAGPISPRIIGGGALGGEHYTVSVQHSGNHICGGSVLPPSTAQTAPQGKNFILTAAHCVYGLKATDLKVLAGTTKLTEKPESATRVLVQVTKIHLHDNFDIFDLLNDIAVLEVDQIKGVGTDIKTVSITSKEFPDTGESYEFSGWGLDGDGKQSNELQTLLQTVLLEADCQKGVNQLCAKSDDTTKRGACFKDAGGPLIKLKKIQNPPETEPKYKYDGEEELVSTNEQVGIVSYGYGCAKGKPDVFTNVNPYSEFINDILEGKQK